MPKSRSPPPSCGPPGFPLRVVSPGGPLHPATGTDRAGPDVARELATVPVNLVIRDLVSFRQVPQGTDKRAVRKMAHSRLNRLAFLGIFLVSGMILAAVAIPPLPPDATGQQEDRLGDREPLRPPADPDEQLFVDWPDPQATLFVTGRQNGYLEPCGCTGLDNQKGGMMRRHTLYSELQERGWNPIGLDLGNQVRRYGRQASLKMVTSYESLGFDMQYQAIGFGPDDLKLPAIELMAAMTNSGLSTENFVAANVTVYDAGFTSRYRVLPNGEMRIGVTMILDDEYLASITPDKDIRLTPAGEALAAIAEPLQAEQCDRNVLLAFASLEKCREFARQYPWFDVIVSGGVDGEPTREPEVLESSDGQTTWLIQTGYKGMYVGVVGFFDDPETPMRYQRVPLDARFEDSEAIKVRFLRYQRQMEALGLEGLDIRPATHASGRTYVGSEVCADCHDHAYEVWREGIDGLGGPHFRATLDLTDPGERTWVQRHHDPECLSCHVTGWNPQQFYPWDSGYLELADEALHGNGCENCHGPGSHHVAAENGELDVDEPTRTGYLKEMIVTLEEARTSLCFECHDMDNSPDFHKDGAFEKYWKQIEHYE